MNACIGFICPVATANQSSALARTVMATSSNSPVPDSAMPSAILIQKNPPLSPDRSNKIVALTPPRLFRQEIIDHRREEPLDFFNCSHTSHLMLMTRSKILD